MNSSPSILPTYFGKSLETALDNIPSERKAIIEGFLYEKSALLLYADDGIGKSTLSLQASLQATWEGSKVFGEFNVPISRNLLYFQMERHPDEVFERIRYLKQVISYDSNRFALSASLQGINLQSNLSSKEAFLTVNRIIKEIGFIPDLIVFDPIYAMTSDDLSTAQACNAITRFFRVIQLHINCSILATSHTNRGIRDPETHQRVGKDMYGNRFLSAFFTGSYHIVGRPDGYGTIFKLDKNSQKNLEKQFELVYDPSSYLSWKAQEAILSGKDKLLSFIESCKSQNKEFSFADMQSVSGVSDSTLRTYMVGHLLNKIQVSSKSKYGKILYKSSS